MFIYKLTSPSGNSYVGQTKHNIEKRWKQHVSSWQNWQKDKSRKGVSTKLYFAFDKYPPKDWTKEILCECSTKGELNEKEILYIAEFGHYNMTKGGDGRAVDFLEEDHKENISKSRKEFFGTEEGKVWKEKLSEKFSGKNNPMYGKTYSKSEETKKLISEKMKGKNLGKEPWNKGKDKFESFSDESLKTLRYKAKENHKNGKYNHINRKETSSKCWKIIDPNGNIYVEKGLKQFCEKVNINYSMMVQGAKGNSNFPKGWYCEKIKGSEDPFTL